MTSPRFDKAFLPSRHVSVGPERAPHRSYYYAMADRRHSGEHPRPDRTCGNRLGGVYDVDYLCEPPDQSPEC